MTNDKLEKMLSEMSHVWKTESAFMSWLRGGIRRSLWNRHPVKLEFINKNRKRIPNPNPKGKVKEVWGGVCALTGETHVIANLEVDHVQGNHSLRCIEDIQKFVEGISIITLDDLQFVSKEAHKIKSYAEKHNVSFEEARVEKKAIQLVKDKLDIAFLKDNNVEAATTQVARRKQIKELLLKQLSKEKEIE